MRLLNIIDSFNYEGIVNKTTRESARAIIIENNKLLMVKSKKENFYKFPGGGINIGESKIDCLIRETKEEVGLICKKSSIKEYGYVIERNKSDYDANEIFEQISYYYFLQVFESREEQNLDEYEKDLDYILEAIGIDEAISVNNKYNKFNGKLKYILREQKVLELLKEEIFNNN